MTQSLTIGISSCLLGNKVRYDGSHQMDRYIVNTLGKYLSYIPVCPEVECGLPTPRESLRLVGDPEAPRLITRKTGEDHTDRMQDWAKERIAAIAKEDLCGFIFKSKSPSSGMERIRVYNTDGNPVSRKGVGIFARMFMEAFPLIPVEEDGRLHDAKLRENFIVRIFAMQRWRSVRKEPSLGKLVAFHTANKLLIMAHNEVNYRAMGKLVATGKQWEPTALFTEYERLLLKALGHQSTTKTNTNVLQHMMGYFKEFLTTDEKQELLEVIRSYHEGITPLIVPITLINHYVRKYDVAYLAGQTYLSPHPTELALRNHV